MDESEVSAFYTYSVTKKPKKVLSLKKKLKKKSKKKKLRELDASSAKKSLVKISESSNKCLSAPNSVPQKSKKKNDKKKLIEALVNKEKTILKYPSAVSNVNNFLVNGNGFYNKSTNDDMMKTSLTNKSEKVKEKKIKKLKKLRAEDRERIIKAKRAVENGFVQSKSEIFGILKNRNEEKEMSDNNSGLSSIIYSDSVKLGEEVFSWLLSPMTLKDFFKTCWEQKPLHITHNNENYFKCICSLEDFKEALRVHDMYFTKNIDVTSYIDGERATENPEGKAKPSVVWDLYKNGRSIRLLNPQTFIPNIQLLNSTLQEFFRCFVGANIYLTPAGTQGFAPHYDDIEAFVLQLEGEKHWKLYNPRVPNEVLPRESSRNFKEDEIGEPILEVTLKPGDLLYFPRGIIHQAKCLPHVHSLHITVSCYQRNSWADLLEKVIPVALESAISEDVEFRKGLPIGYLNSMGVIYSDRESDERQQMKEKFFDLFNRILEYCPLDAGVDQLGANYTYDALPPWVTEVEKTYGADRGFNADSLMEGLLKSKNQDLGVKLIRATSVRLVSEEGEILLYYTTDNSLVYHEHESCSVKITIPWAEAIEFLIHSYPEFVQMKDLPLGPNNTNKPGKWRRIVDFVYFLWQKGLILFNQPLEKLCS